MVPVDLNRQKTIGFFVCCHYSKDTKVLRFCAFIPICEVMKILFVDNSAELQQKWIDPLRAEGWGALRARSVADADRMLSIHGDSIEVVVINEALVQWAEKQDFPFVVLTQKWQEKDILAHQNSKRSAFFYQPFSGRVQDLQTAIHSYRSGGPVGAKNENTQWSATRTISLKDVNGGKTKEGKSQSTRAIALEDFTNVLTKPEVTRTEKESSIKLEAPSVLFGGESTNADKTTVSPGLPASKDQSEPAEISLDFGSKPEATRVSIPVPPTVPASDATRVSIPNPALPEVMEVKLDFDGPAAEIESTRLSIPVPPVEQKSADPTAVLEPTKIELTNGDQTAHQIDAIAEEQELVGELSINEEISLRDIVGGAPLMQAGSVPMPPPPPSSAAAHTLIGSIPAQQPMFQAPPVVRVIEGDEALKNYLSMREQDVAVLTGQVRSSQERIAQLEAALKVEKARSTELQHMVQKQEQQIKNYDQDKQVEVEVLYRQVEDLNNQLQERTNKAHSIEAKLRMTTDEVNKVKERVRVDIRRIRVREKELESQLEILKKDSAALLQARDEKILELKRKLDLLEFNMELIQEQYNKERQSSEDLRNRLKDAAKAMRQAGGLLEQ